MSERSTRFLHSQPLPQYIRLYDSFGTGVRRPVPSEPDECIAQATFRWFEEKVGGIAPRITRPTLPDLRSAVFRRNPSSFCGAPEPVAEDRLISIQGVA